MGSSFRPRPSGLTEEEMTECEKGLANTALEGKGWAQMTVGRDWRSPVAEEPERRWISIECCLGGIR